MHDKYEHSISYQSKIMARVKVLNMQIKGHGQGHQVKTSHCWKDLITRNVQKKTLNGSKVMAKVKDFRNVGQRSRSMSEGNRPCFIWKGFISWVYMPNMKSLSLTVQTLWPRLKVIDMWVKVTRSKLLTWSERTHHKECTSEIWNLYL